MQLSVYRPPNNRIEIDSAVDWMIFHDDTLLLEKSVTDFFQENQIIFSPLRTIIRSKKRVTRARYNTFGQASHFMAPSPPQKVVLVMFLL